MLEFGVVRGRCSRGKENRVAESKGQVGTQANIEIKARRRDLSAARSAAQRHKADSLMKELRIDAGDLLAGSYEGLVGA